ncbi:hypothetical protein PCANC_03939 [Puccinia coronata f. sp. avenae]|uniref:Uncharacterized protein n=1 Tax=Puccinia coronata f. sp. avenae TaxID=200324 RepID=A0A2N5W1E5_9BASI|nr:hypothetical protein PCANC_17179 [Puccinia coronata f. sp. avenae]PLW49302.1 hypothetical protein PCASD_02710 [Puccinia coronata f. sp. avenae]PLW56020.1 hypothetical protein PCANC_03939 [Puccinia coronata f. sp. avenae]
MAHDVRNIYTHARMAITSNLIQLPQPDAAPSHPAIVSERPADGLSQNRQIPWENYESLSKDEIVLLEDHEK